MDQTTNYLELPLADLFIWDDGCLRPMVFTLGHCRQRDSIILMIEEGGGVVQAPDSKDEVGCRIALSDKKHFKDSNHEPENGDVFDLHFITDSYKANELKRLIDYRLNAETKYTYSNNDELHDIMLGTKKWSDFERQDQPDDLSGESCSDIDENFGESHPETFGATRITKSSLNYKRERYLTSDQRAIVNYLIEKKAYSLTKGNSIWRQMYNDNVCNKRHSFQSLKEHFRRQIYPQLNSFQMTEKQLQRFRRCWQGLKDLTDSEEEEFDSPSKHRRHHRRLISDSDFEEVTSTSTRGSIQSKSPTSPALTILDPRTPIRNSTQTESQFTPSQTSTQLPLSVPEPQPGPSGTSARRSLNPDLHRSNHDDDPPSPSLLDNPSPMMLLPVVEDLSMSDSDDSQNENSSMESSKSFISCSPNVRGNISIHRRSNPLIRYVNQVPRPKIVEQQQETTSTSPRSPGVENLNTDTSRQPSPDPASHPKDPVPNNGEKTSSPHNRQKTKKFGPLSKRRQATSPTQSSPEHKKNKQTPSHQAQTSNSTHRHEDVEDGDSPVQNRQFLSSTPAHSGTAVEIYDDLPHLNSDSSSSPPRPARTSPVPQLSPQPGPSSIAPSKAGVTTPTRSKFRLYTEALGPRIFEVDITDRRKKIIEAAHEFGLDIGSMARTSKNRRANQVPQVDQIEIDNSNIGATVVRKQIPKVGRLESDNSNIGATVVRKQVPKVGQIEIDNSNIGATVVRKQVPKVGRLESDNSNIGATVVRKQILKVGRIESDNSSINAATARDPKLLNATVRIERLRIDVNTVAETDDMPFSRDEEELIIDYIVSNDHIREVQGKAVWKLIKAEGLVKDRSPATIKKHFFSRMFPNLKSFGLSSEQLKEFGRSEVAGSGSSIISDFSMATTNKHDQSISAKEFYSKPKAGPSNRPPNRKGKIVKMYSRAEDEKIVHYIAVHRRYKEVGGNVLWEGMERKNIVPHRSSQSLKERFRRYIIKKIENFSNVLSTEEINAFKQQQQAQQACAVNKKKR